MKIHYSGGLRFKHKDTLTISIRLYGWPVCCSGKKAENIREKGNYTLDDQSSVTCKKCLAVIKNLNHLKSEK